MALQSPFFGKRDNDGPAPRSLPTGTTPRPTAGIAPAQPQATTATGQPMPATSTTASAAVAGQPSADKSTRAGAESLLKVGPMIRLKGVEITDCDTLFVEGTVEATMDSRVIHIAETGAFKGSAEIDIAEIHGEFSGTLTVRQKLVIYSTGKVNGKIRYGKLVVEEGGQLAGEIMAGFAAPASSGSDAHRAAPHLRGAEPAVLVA